MVIVDIFFRYLHVIAACLAIGGAFFLRVLLPIGTSQLSAEDRDAAFLRCRRAYKMVVHPCILAFLVSGIYNAWRNWPKYRLSSEINFKPVVHGFFGTHLLLALLVIGISLWMLAGREPPRNHRTWMRTNLLLMGLAVLAASALKWARDYTVSRHAEIVESRAALKERPLRIVNEILIDSARPPTTLPATLPSSLSPATQPSR